jgi:hypothetical protein
VPSYAIEIDDSSPDWLCITVVGSMADAEAAADAARRCVRDQLGVPRARMTVSVRPTDDGAVVTLRTHTLGMLLMGKPLQALHGLLMASGAQVDKSNRNPISAEKKARAKSAAGGAAKLRPESID